MSKNSSLNNSSETASLTALKTPISKDALDQLFHESRTHALTIQQTAAPQTKKEIPRRQL